MQEGSGEGNGEVLATEDSTLDPILLLNKQISAEAFPILYKERFFNISIQSQGFDIGGVHIAPQRCESFRPLEQFACLSEVRNLKISFAMEEPDYPSYYQNLHVWTHAFPYSMKDIRQFDAAYIAPAAWNLRLLVQGLLSRCARLENIVVETSCKCSVLRSMGMEVVNANEFHHEYPRPENCPRQNQMECLLQPLHRLRISGRITLHSDCRFGSLVRKDFRRMAAVVQSGAPPAQDSESNADRRARVWLDLRERLSPIVDARCNEIPSSWVFTTKELINSTWKQARQETEDVERSKLLAFDICQGYEIVRTWSRVRSDV